MSLRRNRAATQASRPTTRSNLTGARTTVSPRRMSPVVVCRTAVQVRARGWCHWFHVSVRKLKPFILVRNVLTQVTPYFTLFTVCTPHVSGKKRNDVRAGQVTMLERYFVSVSVNDHRRPRSGSEPATKWYPEPSVISLLPLHTDMYMCVQIDHQQRPQRVPAEAMGAHHGGGQGRAGYHHRESV